MKGYRVISSFLMFTALLAVPPLLLGFTGHGNWLIQGFWAMFAFTSVITFFTIGVVLLVQRKSNEMYAQAFMGATVFKMLFLLIFVLVFIKKNHPDKVNFVLDMMYLYLLNTAFEVYGLLSNLRDQKK